jgi:hypothetical protein
MAVIPAESHEVREHAAGEMLTLPSYAVQTTAVALLSGKSPPAALDDDGHTGGFAAQPREYGRSVVGSFDRALVDRGAQRPHEGR